MNAFLINVHYYSDKHMPGIYSPE